MNEDQNEQGAEKFRLLYRFLKVCQRWMDEGCWSLVLAERGTERERVARWFLVLAQRPHQNGKYQPGQSLCSRNAAHQINRIFRVAVLVHARTFGLIQAAPEYEGEQAWKDHL
jgi:hypothetical protein